MTRERRPLIEALAGPQVPGLSLPSLNDPVAFGKRESDNSDDSGTQSLAADNFVSLVPPTRWQVWPEGDLGTTFQTNAPVLPLQPQRRRAPLNDER